jgi:GTP-binding protein HflX
VVTAKIKEISPSLYIGKGKVEELALTVAEEGIDVVIFNNNLKASQQGNLEEALGVKTIDRTQLILDIFSRHARTREGSLQVELAQLEYLLPRLKGKGIMLSRQAGGIGTVGPGEKKLEIDRRKIDDRVVRLRQELAEVRRHRDTTRKKREKEKAAICSLVGYTSAGKTTLFNTLTESNEKISDTLFTTLDPVSRTFNLRENLKVIITDTVGFLYKLPLNLIEAFKATLEELQYADALLHVVDASSNDILRLMSSVDSILKELKLDSKPLILLFNKIDKLSPESINIFKNKYPDAILVSALTKTNLEALKERIYRLIFKDMVEVVVKVPFNRMELVDYIHTNCEVIKTAYDENHTIYFLKIKKDNLSFFEKKGIEAKEMSR